VKTFANETLFAVIGTDTSRTYGTRVHLLCNGSVGWNWDTNLVSV
jgi:hypothetical protein